MVRLSTHAGNLQRSCEQRPRTLFPDTQLILFMETHNRYEVDFDFNNQGHKMYFLFIFNIEFVYINLICHHLVLLSPLYTILYTVAC